MAADLDLVNMFGNGRVARHPRRPAHPTSPRLPPGPSGSTNLTPSPTLPSGRAFSTDRGAEQGDVLGTIQFALVLGDARETHMQDFLSTPFEQRRAFATNGSSMTGSALSGPCSLTGGFAHWTPPWPPLAPHGAALSSATPRAPLGSCVHPSELMSFNGWDTAYVRDTVVVLSPDAGTTALGSAFGTREQINAPGLGVGTRPATELRSAINGVDHAPTELVLTRQCADVSKLMYHMRINGDILDHDLFASFDGQLRASVSNSLCGDLPDHSWWQAHHRCVGWEAAGGYARP